LRALSELRVSRTDLVLQSKCGIRFAGDGGEGTPGQIELLSRSVRQPFVANQLQLSLVHSHARRPNEAEIWSARRVASRGGAGLTGGLNPGRGPRGAVRARSPGGRAGVHTLASAVGVLWAHTSTRPAEPDRRA
jgi:hypothetical protein